MINTPSAFQLSKNLGHHLCSVSSQVCLHNLQPYYSKLSRFSYSSQASLYSPSHCSCCSQSRNATYRLHTVHICVILRIHTTDNSIYRSLAKKGPLTKRAPPPTFGTISCIGSKFTRMSAHPGANFAWSLRSMTYVERSAYLREETSSNTSLKLTQSIFA